jgi:glycosyltransferase involved in cell wall biosynthesis
MKINVLVPSFNHAPFIEKTLRSIFLQTHLPQKLIVIDDGSTDNSVEIIKNTLKDAPFETHLIARENKGLTKTLNEGFQFCSADAEFFAYIGSDDVWFPQFLEERLKLLQENSDAVLVFGHAFLIDEKDNVIESTENWFDFNEDKMLEHLLRGEIFPSPSVVYRNSFLRKHRWNEDAILEDYELYLKLVNEGRFIFDKRVLCAWRQHRWNTSRNFPKMMNEWLAAQNRVLGNSYPELEKLQKQLKFKCVADFVRFGYRTEAVKLFWENLDGAVSLSQVIGLTLRMAIPHSFFQANRRRKMRRNIKKYGNLSDYLTPRE